MGTQLVQQHITFSAAVPTRNGLEIYEVRTQKDFQQMLMHWMCFPLQQTEGAGMRYFLTQQMDRQYARLVLLTAGPYTASLKPLEGRIGTTVISAVSGGKLQHIAVGGGYEVVDFKVTLVDGSYQRGDAHETSADRYGLPGKKRKQSSVSAVALPARGPAYGGRAHSAHGHLEC